MRVWLYVSLLFLFSVFRNGKTELYTALADLEELLQTESVLINNLEQYLKVQEEKLDLLRRCKSYPGNIRELILFSFRYVNLYKQQHDKASEDIQMYVANPINAYLLVKRLTTDWKQVEELMLTDVGKGISVILKNQP